MAVVHLPMAGVMASSRAETSYNSKAQNASQNAQYRHIIHSTLALIQTLGIYPILRKQFSSPEAISENEFTQWGVVVSSMIKLWKVVCMGCGILLPLSFGFFQIGGVSENVYSRTAAFSLRTCSGMGLITGIWYLYLETSFRQQRLAKSWVAASLSSGDTMSINFWTLLSLPFSLLAWSVLFCVTAFATAVYVSSSQTSDISSTSLHTNTEQIFSMIFLTSLALGHLTQVYRSIRYIVRM